MGKLPSLNEALRTQILVGDGAMATYLYGEGVPIGVCYEELSLSRPDLIHAVHRAYYDAGARLITTNTFGAHYQGLSRYGLEDQVEKINRTAAELAREAVGEDAYVVGDIGSIRSGKVYNSPMDGFADQFSRQAAALLSGGIDGILLETFLDVDELLLALEVIRPLTDLPIIAQLAILEAGRTRDGFSLGRAFRMLCDAGADVVGLNCRMGPTEILRSLEKTTVPADVFLSVFPNAGRLGMTDGELAYKSSPAYFAENALRFREQGVRIIGGCCGTTPEHIRAIAGALRGLEPMERRNPVEDIAVLEPVFLPTPAEKGREESRRKPTIVDLVKQRHTVIVEFDPPRDLNIDRYLAGSAAIQRAGADAITMADNSLATTRMSNMALASIIKNRLGVEPLPHVACRDRNLIGQQSHLMGFHALGINQILVITGDPSRFGDLPGASSVYDLTSFDLIRMVKQLNEGLTFSGKIMKQKAQFVVGAAFNPHVRNFAAAVKRLEKKVEAGADFIMTQPVYDKETLRLIYEGTRHIPIPIFIGIMPLTGIRNAEFLHHEVPGIKLSEEALNRMRNCPPSRAKEEGVAMAKELLLEAMPYFNGIYLITPFANYEMTAELCSFVRTNSSLRDAASGLDCSEGA